MVTPHPVFAYDSAHADFHKIKRPFPMEQKRMRIRAARPTFLSIAVFFLVSTMTRLVSAQAPTIELVLSFTPTHKHGLEYDTPKPSQYKQCKIKVERKGKVSGWVVFGPRGQVIRRFVDSNGDNVVDQRRYYHLGLEVYRDLDTDFNNKMDQSRWLNTAGSKWGLDTNEDGWIDTWKTLSAPEAAREAVRALILNEARYLKPIVINDDDMKQLQMSASLTKKLRQAVSDSKTKLDKILEKGSSITSDSKWMRYDGGSPGIIPAESGKAGKDIFVYENVMAIIETNQKAGLVQIGELIRVGETWKLTQLPQPLTGNSQITIGGIMMQPSIEGLENTTTAPAVTGISPEMTDLLGELQQLDEKAPKTSSSREEISKYNAQRADILQKLVEKAEGEKERSQWMRQLIDGVTAAIQSGTYPAGVTRLKHLETEATEKKDSKLLAYIRFRRLLAEYTQKLQKAADNKKRTELQKGWMKDLEGYLSQFPNVQDSSNAMLQLAIANEFNAKFDGAKKWYEKASKNFPTTPAGKRATGAARRLELVGKKFDLSGPGFDGNEISSTSYKGKVTVVVFWASWSRPLVDDLPQIHKFYKENKSRGFEILGVNLDLTADVAKAFVKKNGIDWKQIYVPGGLESAPGLAYGIISLPTMFLVDAQGNVVNRAITVSEIIKQVPDMLKKTTASRDR